MFTRIPSRSSRQATDLFNTRKLDFVIELGDFKDCKDDGDREGTA